MRLHPSKTINGLVRSILAGRDPLDALHLWALECKRDCLFDEANYASVVVERWIKLKARLPRAEARHQLRNHMAYAVAKGWRTNEDRLPPKQMSLTNYEGQTLAHVMRDAGYFPSISEAKRAGWNRPAVAGSYRVGKHNLTLS